MTGVTFVREHSLLGKGSLNGWSPVLQGCIREMEYIERASFVEIYGLKLAYPISLLSLCFDFFLSGLH